MGEGARQGGWGKNKKTLSPIRGESVNHAVPPDLPSQSLRRFQTFTRMPDSISFVACNGANRSPYSLTALGLPLAGGFHRALPEQALNHRPCSLCRRTDRLLVPVAAFRYKFSYYKPLSRLVKQWWLILPSWPEPNWQNWPYDPKGRRRM